MAEYWEQLPDETNRAYEAFLHYLKLGYKRSARQVAILLGSKSTTYVSEWCAKYNWVARVKAYEQNEWKMRNKAMAEALTLLTEKHLEQAKSYRELLKIPMNILSQKMKIVDGKLVNPEELSDMKLPELYDLVFDTINAFEKIVKIERLSLNIPTEITDNTNHNHDETETYGDKIAKNEDATKKLTEFLRSVAGVKNGKSNNNGVLHN
jgi:hypothetical protein